MAALLAAPTEVLAQTDRGLNFELRGRAQYDSNVARANKVAPIVDNIEPGDIRYTVSAAVDTSRPIGRQTATLTGSVSYDFFQKNKSLERWHADITGRVGGQVGPCAGGVNAAYLRTIAELSPLSLTDPRDSVENVLTYGATASCPLVGSIGSTVAVQQNRVRTSGSRSQIGSDSTSISTSVGYVSRTFGSFSAVGAYATTDYLTPSQPLPFATSGFESYSVGLLYSRPIGTRLTGSANVSYFELHRGGSRTDAALTGGDTSGVSWGLQFGYRASSRLSMAVGYTDGTTATARIGSAYQKQRRFNGNASYQASSRLSASIFANYVIRDFSGTVSDDLGVASKEERFGYGAGVSYKVGQNISLSLDASRSKTDTDQQLLNYTSEKVSVTVTTRF